MVEAPATELGTVNNIPGFIVTREPVNVLGMALHKLAKFCKEAMLLSDDNGENSGLDCRSRAPGLCVTIETADSPPFETNRGIGKLSELLKSRLSFKLTNPILAFSTGLASFDSSPVFESSASMDSSGSIFTPILSTGVDRALGVDGADISTSDPCSSLGFFSSKGSVWSHSATRFMPDKFARV